MTAAAAADVHGFARARTSFVGRAGEVDEVAALLGEYRMVTVTGPGGVGKTRLSGEVARRTAARFADGAWLVVELAAVQDPALVPLAVAAVLAVPQVAGVLVPGLQGPAPDKAGSPAELSARERGTGDPGRPRPHGREDRR